MKKELRKVNEAIEYLAKLQDSYSDKTFGLDKLKKALHKMLPNNLMVLIKQRVGRLTVEEAELRGSRYA